VQVAQVGVTVPSSLLVAAQRSPVEFAMALANASVPAGLEIRESDDVPPDARPTSKVDREREVPVSEVVKAFEARRRDYRVVVMQGVLVIRPIDGTLSFLDEASTIDPPVSVVGVMASVRRVLSPLDPRLSGVVLNSYGRKGEDVPVMLDGSGGRQVIDTLNQIVKQAPPRTWVVTTRRKETTCGLLALDSLRQTAAAALSQCRASNPPLMGRADSWTTGPWHR
jgi:hypothetical protein